MSEEIDTDGAEGAGHSPGDASGDRAAAPGDGGGGADSADGAHGGDPGGPGAYAERVLETVELIPPGRVMSYGDIAEWLGEGGPRQVGHVLARYGGGVPWWRVVRADGVLLPGHELRALDAYRAEGTPLRAAGPASEGHVPRVDMRRARWDGRAPGAEGAPGG